MMNKNETELSVLIADDHQLVRETLAVFMRMQPGLAVTTADSLHNALDCIAEAGGFDVVLLDVNMSGMTGIPSIRRTIAANPGGAVVVFSGNVGCDFVSEAISAGARGFIPKTLPSKSLIAAIRFIAAGETFLPLSFMAERQEEEPGPLSQLSPQEQRVLGKLREGLMNKEIARELGLSEMTIKMHVRSICSKLGARNRTHAVMIALSL